MECIEEPPTKKQRTLSPTSLAEFKEEGDDPHLSDRDPKLDGSDIGVVSDFDDSMEISNDADVGCELTTERLFTEYIHNNENNDAMVQKGLGILWGRLGGGEFAASVTMAVQRQRAEILDLGGHWTLTNVMTRNFPNNASIQIQCCSILKELLLQGWEARYQVYCTSSLGAVISAMNRFRFNPHMQLRGCQFLAHMLISPVSTAILEDLVRSTMHLDSILRLLRFEGNACWAGSDLLEGEIRQAAKSLLVLVVSQCPCGMRTELMGAIEQQVLETMSGDHDNLLTLLKECESYSVRDEQHVL